jgi:hypothetical protein
MSKGFDYDTATKQGVFGRTQSADIVVAKDKIVRKGLTDHQSAPAITEDENKVCCTSIHMPVLVLAPRPIET